MKTPAGRPAFAPPERIHGPGTPARTLPEGAAMSRIIWILVFLIGAVLFVKPLRDRARPHIDSALTPVYKWDAKNRVNEVYRLLQRERATGGLVPAPRDFEKFLVQREGPDAALDPWGQPFF